MRNILLLVAVICVGYVLVLKLLSEPNLEPSPRVHDHAKFVEDDDKSWFRKGSVNVDPNAILDSHANGYKNSEKLVNKLKPKLAKPFMSDLDKGKKFGSVLLEDIGAARNQDDLKKREEGYRMFAFNTLVSSRIGIASRELPDTRHKACQSVVYPEPNQLPTASVIICFYREDLTTLLRTIQTVIDRSPASVLREVILVNDMSDIDIVDDVENFIMESKLSGLVTLLNAPEVSKHLNQ